MKILNNLKKYIFHRSFFKQRIFWKTELIYKHGFYYYVWTNWFLEETETVFCGYVHHTLDKKDTSFKTVIARLNAK